VVVPKQVTSAFIGTPLAQLLREAGCSQVVVTGVITNNSVEGEYCRVVTADEVVGALS